MSPPQDQFIDEEDEEELCPLCVEELDLTDKNFRPCPCGYQICQFCYNNIKTTMNGLCPACRRKYEDKNIQYKAPSPEEMVLHKQNQAQQAKKKAAAKQKEAQKREADHLSRKHLAGLRVRQKNLVYITGLKPKVVGDKLVDKLRGHEYFGQYGDIVKIVVSKPKESTQSANQPVAIYITFVKKEDAAACILACDNVKGPDGTKLRAQYGTTKYCSAYLRGDTCTNKSCMFLHEPGEDSESFTRQDLSSLNAYSSQQSVTPAPSILSQPPPPPPPPPPQAALPVAAAIQDIDGAVVSVAGSPSDGPALPATANWGDLARRASRATASSTNSPQVSSVIAVKNSEAIRSDESRPPVVQKKSEESKKSRTQRYPYLEDLPKKCFASTFGFTFAYPSHFSEIDIWLTENIPPLFDPAEAQRRQILKEKELEEYQRQQSEVDRSEQNEDFEDPVETLQPGGSSQLGGEPEEHQDRDFGQRKTIGSHSGLGEDFAQLGLSDNRQLQQQQSLLLQQLRLSDNNSNNSQNGVQAGHGRQPSRFFDNVNSKQASKQSLGGLSSHFPPNQGSSGPGQFGFTSVSGPPPGLKTTGTPPVSGGGMFAQGHGFTQDGRYGAQNEKSWDQRGRGNLGTEPGKRDILFSSSHQFPSSSSSPAPPSSLSFPYGGPPGILHDNNVSQKPKKKGKKHRHANTPSFGGGVVDVADPSILQMRVGSSSMSGQSTYGGQGQNAFPSSMHNNNNTAFRDSSSYTNHSNKVIEPIQSITKTRNHAANPLTIDSPVSTVKYSDLSAMNDSESNTSSPKILSNLNSQKSLLVKKSHDALISDGNVSSLPWGGMGMPSRTNILRSSSPKVDNSQIQDVKVASYGPNTISSNSQISDSQSRTSSLQIMENLKEAKESGPVLASPRVVSTPVAAPESPSSLSRQTTSAGSETLLKRNVQLRTLRITETQKNDIITSLPSATGSRVSSRRPSVTSIQPTTPLSERVDSPVVTSATTSRPTSPTPVVGKRRSDRAKAKKKVEKNQVGDIVPQAIVEEEHSPIYSRKKKSKKPAQPIPKIAPSIAVKPKAPPVEDENTIPILETTSPIIETAPEEPQAQALIQEETEDAFDVRHPILSIDFEDLLHNATSLLQNPLTNKFHLRSLPERRPFATEEDFHNYTTWLESPSDKLKTSGTQGDGTWPPIAFDGVHPDGTTELLVPTSAVAPFCKSMNDKGLPARVVTPNKRLSGTFIQTPTAQTDMYALTEDEMNTLVAIESRIAAHAQSPNAPTSFWGSGNPKYLPQLTQILEHNVAWATQQRHHRSRDVFLGTSAQHPRGAIAPDAHGIIRMDEAESPAALINRPLMEAHAVIDPRMGVAMSGPDPDGRGEWSGMAPLENMQPDKMDVYLREGEILEQALQNAIAMSSGLHGEDERGSSGTGTGTTGLMGPSAAQLVDEAHDIDEEWFHAVIEEVKGDWEKLKVQLDKLKRKEDDIERKVNKLAKKNKKILEDASVKRKLRSV